MWILGYFFIEQPMALGTATFIAALILTGAEIFFHMRRRFFNSPSADEENQSTAPPESENEQQRSSVRDLQTEYGEDMYAKLSAKDPKSKKQQ